MNWTRNKFWDIYWKHKILALSLILSVTAGDIFNNFVIVVLFDKVRKNCTSNLLRLLKSNKAFLIYELVVTWNRSLISKDYKKCFWKKPAHKFYMIFFEKNRTSSSKTYYNFFWLRVFFKYHLRLVLRKKLSVNYANLKFLKTNLANNKLFNPKLARSDNNERIKN